MEFLLTLSTFRQNLFNGGIRWGEKIIHKIIFSWLSFAASHTLYQDDSHYGDSAHPIIYIILKWR